MFGFPPLKRPFHKTAKDADVGRPDRRLKIATDWTITVCNECESEIKRVGPDLLDWCENCQSLEQPTFTIEGADDCDCSMGADGDTPTTCRQCRARGELGV